MRISPDTHVETQRYFSTRRAVVNIGEVYIVSRLSRSRIALAES